MSSRQWGIGDRVIHAAKPEWGTGEVRAAERVVQDGQPGQRLTVRFDRAGVKTLATPFADIRPAESAPVPVPEESPDPTALATPGLVQRMTSLPDDATDPFRSRRSRLQATLGLYKYSGTGASLLDWAATLCGMKDPLSRFSRHELEEFFRRFRDTLDGHLKRLAQEVRKEDPRVLAEMTASAPPAAQQVLKRLDTGR
jgi:hypothetical protein